MNSARTVRFLSNTSFSGTANVSLESMYCIVLQSPGLGIGNGEDGYTAVQPVSLCLCSLLAATASAFLLARMDNLHNRLTSDLGKKDEIFCCS